MNCPKCKKPGAYVGSREIECLNQNCEHYSEKWVAEMAERILSLTPLIPAAATEDSFPIPVGDPTSFNMPICMQIFDDLFNESWDV